MMGYALLDKDGWVKAVVMGDNVKPEHYPSFDGHIKLKNEEISRIKHVHTSLFWDGKKLCQVKDKKGIWNRLRATNLTGRSCIDAMKRHNDLHEYEDIPKGIVIDNGEKIKKMFDYPETEILLGYKVMLSGEEDFELWESQMVMSGLYTPDEAWERAASWLTDPWTWPIKAVWRDIPSQIEIFHLGGSDSVYGGFAAHIDRTLPRLFWKQITLPTLKALYSYGFQYITSSVRIDKPRYVAFLNETYGHEILRKTDKVINLRLNIKDAISKIENSNT